MPSFDADRIRNLLVHFYWKTDDTKVFRVIREDLGDIGIFLELVARLVYRAGKAFC